MMEESLFSLEILIDCIENLQVHCALPAISFRFLDFPINTIYQLDPQAVDELKQQYSSDQLNSSFLPRDIEQKVRNYDGSYTINRGKSCLFKMNLKDLREYLSSTPLCLMIIDVWQKVPKLVGSILISLNHCMEKIYAKTSRLDINIPVIIGEKGTFPIHNLMGAKIGMMSLKYKLLSMGQSLLPHVTDNLSTVNQQQQSLLQAEVSKTVNALINGPNDEHDKEQSLPVKSSKKTVETQTEVKKSKLRKENELLLYKEFTQEDRNIPQNISANIFCPVPLYYNSLSDDQGLKVGTCRYQGSESSDGSDYVPEILEVDTSPDSIKSQMHKFQNQDKTIPVKGTDSRQVHSRSLSVSSKAQLRSKLNEFPILNALLSEILDLVKEVDVADDEDNSETNSSLIPHSSNETNEITLHHNKDKYTSKKGSTLKFRSTKTQRLRFAKIKEKKRVDKISNDVGDRIVNNNIKDAKVDPKARSELHSNVIEEINTDKMDSSNLNKNYSSSENGVDNNATVSFTENHTGNSGRLQPEKDNSTMEEGDINNIEVLSRNDPGFSSDFQDDGVNSVSSKNWNSLPDMHGLVKTTETVEEPDLQSYHESCSPVEGQSSSDVQCEEPNLRPYSDAKSLAYSYVQDFLKAEENKEPPVARKESLNTSKQVDSKSSSASDSKQRSLLSEHEDSSHGDPSLRNNDGDRSGDEYSQDFEEESYPSDFESFDEN
ncbi:Microtubule-associated protein 10 [Trichoplax sp. H2]|nr:Microtubule-associated protein 10 [Trichoplax sp. H2]|eukprot:RDD47377.1 Microtubule-associated protein 10 [Trichoplax sp. H2]